MKRWILLFTLLFISACASTVKPYDQDVSLAPESNGEDRLWLASEKFDKAIRKSGKLFNDPTAEAYVQQVLDKLFPERVGELRVLIIDSPDLNAMALPNGSIYINTGLLAAMQNEAQLATVLAHEGVHVIQRHSASGRETAKKASGWAFALGIALASIGIPADLSSLGLYSVIAGHSRDHEQEADDLGFVRLADANYDTKEAPKVFEQMIIEVESLEIKQPYFFATHPKLQNRVDNFNKLAEAHLHNTDNILGEDSFNSALQEVRKNALRDKLDSGRYNSLISLLSQESISKSYPQVGYYILGESYRLRNNDGDLSLAVSAYQQAIDNGYQSADIHLSKGLIAYKNNDFINAENSFNKYLNLAHPDESERSFVELYLQKIRAK